MMKKIAEVRGGVVVARHEWPDNAVISGKLSSDGGPIFRPLTDAGAPAFDPATQKVTKQDVIVQASVTVQYTVVAKTAPEIAASKDFEVASLSGSVHKVLVKAIQMLANDNRRIKRKINDIITQQGISGQVPVFPAGQTTSPANDLTVQQVVDAVRAQLDV